MNSVEAEIRRLAEESPDFVYKESSCDKPSCIYKPTEENPKGCIIGAALTNLGHKYEDRWEGLPAQILLEALDVDADFVWVDMVQRLQDNGRSWKEALAGADKARCFRVFQEIIPGRAFCVSNANWIVEEENKLRMITVRDTVYFCETCKSSDCLHALTIMGEMLRRTEIYTEEESEDEEDSEEDDEDSGDETMNEVE